MDEVYVIILIWLGVINIYGFLVFGLDKLQAKKHGRRISEHHLIFVSCIGGALGVYLGMQTFRHKTRKKKFIITVPILCAFWLVIAVLTVYKYCNIK